MESLALVPKIATIRMVTATLIRLHDKFSSLSMKSINQQGQGQGEAALLEFLKNHDVMYRLSVIRGIVSDLASHTAADCAPMSICLGGILGASNSVEEAKNRIDADMAEHEQKYLSGWRSVDLTESLAALREAYLLLESRFEFMCRVAKLAGPAPTGRKAGEEDQPLGSSKFLDSGAGESRPYK